ncbi:hypothetical protein COX11_00355 [Candidatus Berkelbacteria bacterium CG23_combo_of_CG06-09_8_20_14_all_41_73]|uniref:UDP-N-acetylglucosamine--N-acetylmuramyl-(pentapeptide) pyrophosphoryl-undecaprenol N-acetylglucosamine transferase n=3 Tax=Candidatus Berkelbacteria TaxID=1618330 RepID=A0A2M7K2F5_9BACT|nr:MAG: hypothetical protein COX11_00355 [Candidatus Berkelbacteria bacterium CG23_combo_of_CG06-09_8_20_14_all_41_73]PIX30381.1 MAG: hypothetical protein COZ63_00060 [Candidatus Berkelbacteria bacterium CG_4_8_14_3_um_filter_42_13]
MKKKTIFLVGADTGGHVVPTFALAKELEKSKKLRIVVIGVGSEIEKKFYQKLNDVQYLKIMAGKSQFGSLLSKISAFLKSLIGFVQSKYFIIKYQPKLIFLKGNYATLPMAMAARLFGRPVIIHESDAILGRSNRIVSRFAKKVFLSYPEEIYREKIRNAEFCGPILRQEFLSPKEKSDADYKIFDFDKNLPTVLVLGGSLGSRSINQATISILDKVLPDCQIIHQTGESDLKVANEARIKLEEKLRQHYYISSFFDQELFSALRVADIVISRSGSGVFEIAACGKAVILIPYPYASADHQSKNAQYFARKNGAGVIEDKNLSPTVLYSAISKLLGSDKKRRNLAQNLSRAVKLSGREIILDYLKQYLKF